jgi:hypothetical protein
MKSKLVEIYYREQKKKENCQLGTEYELKRREKEEMAISYELYKISTIKELS